MAAYEVTRKPASTAWIDWSQVLYLLNTNPNPEYGVKVLRDDVRDQPGSVRTKACNVGREYGLKLSVEVKPDFYFIKLRGQIAK